MANRGMISENIQKKSLEFLGREIGTRELRLYPYIDYSIKNNFHSWGFEKMNDEELDILDLLEKEKHIKYSDKDIHVTREFYDYMQEILAEGYVDRFLDKN